MGKKISKISQLYADSLEKTLMLEKIDSERRKERHRMRWLNGITDLMDMSLHS